MKSLSDDRARTCRSWLLARGAELRDRLRRVQDDIEEARLHVVPYTLHCRRCAPAS
jgi:hypothetical protein